MRIAPHPAPGRWPNLRPRFPARPDPAARHDGAAASETRTARSVREVLEAGITFFLRLSIHLCIFECAPSGASLKGQIAEQSRENPTILSGKLLIRTAVCEEGESPWTSMNFSAARSRLTNPNGLQFRCTDWSAKLELSFRLSK